MLGDEVAERILELLGKPFTIQGCTVHVGASIGLATRTEETMTVEELIRRADIAMYTAKSRGKNRLEVFEMSLHGDSARPIASGTRARRGRDDLRDPSTRCAMRSMSTW